MLLWLAPSEADTAGILHRRPPLALGAAALSDLWLLCGRRDVPHPQIALLPPLWRSAIFGANIILCSSETFHVNRRMVYLRSERRRVEL